MTVGGIYYTDSVLDEKIAVACREQLRKAFKGEIISVSLKPLDFGDKNIVMPGPRGYLSMFQQILAGLEASSADVIFAMEHDCLYDKSNFNFIPPDKNKFFYNLNWWKVGKQDLAVQWRAVQVSGLVCYRDLALKYYASRVATFDPSNFDRKFEPTVGAEYETWWSEKPMIDIRHQTNTTYNKWKLEHFRDKSTAVNFQSTTIDKIPGWNTDTLDSVIK